MHAFETQVASLRPPVKGTAARLAALGPDGLPLTAGHRSAGEQGRSGGRPTTAIPGTSSSRRVGESRRLHAPAVDTVGPTHDERRRYNRASSTASRDPRKQQKVPTLAQGRLVEVESIEAPASGRAVGAEKTFRAYDPDQVLLLAPSIQDWLPDGHLARFVSDLVDEALDLSAIYAGYVEERGFPPYDPRLMVKLLIYGYATGTPSSRKLEERTHSDVAVRFLCAGQQPDYRPIARFRRRHLDALAGLFVQALRLCKRAGLVGLGTLALDGTKLRANASRHKAMSYDRMVKAARVCPMKCCVVVVIDYAAGCLAGRDGSPRRGRAAWPAGRAAGEETHHHEHDEAQTPARCRAV